MTTLGYRIQKETCTRGFETSLGCLTIQDDAYRHVVEDLDGQWWPWPGPDTVPRYATTVLTTPRAHNVRVACTDLGAKNINNAKINNARIPQ